MDRKKNWGISGDQKRMPLSTKGRYFSRRRFVQGAGVLTSLALAGGIAIYKLLSRNGTVQPSQSHASSPTRTPGATSLDIPSQNPASTPTPTAVQSTMAHFSPELDVYPDMPTASTLSVDEILVNTSTPGVTLSAQDTAVRRAVIAMYQRFGIDVSYDYRAVESSALADLEPKHFSLATPQPFVPAGVSNPDQSNSYLQPLSIDAPFYHAIPANYPRVALPAGYVSTFQFFTLDHVHGDGDGVGEGIAVSTANHPLSTITDLSNGHKYQMHVRPDALSFTGVNAPDHVVYFIDATTNKMLSCWITEPAGNGNYTTRGTAGFVQLPYLGDHSGQGGSGVSALGFLLRPGEATNKHQPIPHALGGPVRRPWKARVYPATTYDMGIDDLNANPQCGHPRPANTGLVPYGGVIQLDPALDLTKLGLSLPAFRILEAWQTYGYYIVDSGCCSDLGLDTGTSVSEFIPYGGIYAGSYGAYGPHTGPGVAIEIQRVLRNSTLYVVPPLVKKRSWK